MLENVRLHPHENCNCIHDGTAEQAEVVLEVKHLTKRFPVEGGKVLTACDDVSLYAYKGQTLGIIGESGCGKSTLVRTILQIHPATSGEVIFEGHDILQLKDEALRQNRRKIQMVFQDPVSSFDPRRTLGEGIGESLRNAGVPRKEAEKRVRQLLEQCGLPEEFAKRYPHEVSGGQCQRAAIARALAIEPQILICDEATSALDVAVQKQIMELLDLLRKEKHLTILFICHNLALVQSFCDRILVMKQGKMVEEGTPEEVIWHPKHPYTKLLVDSVL